MVAAGTLRVLLRLDISPTMALIRFALHDNHIIERTVIRDPCDRFAYRLNVNLNFKMFAPLSSIRQAGFALSIPSTLLFAFLLKLIETPV